MIKKLKHFWTQSISRQLILGIALVHALMMSFFVYDLVDRERDFLAKQSQEQAKGLVETLAANSTSWVLANDFIGIEEVISSQSGFPGLQYAMITEMNGKVLGFTDRGIVGQFIHDKISLQLLNAEYSQTIVLINDSNIIDIAAPIISKGTQVGWARVGISRASITDNLQLVTYKGLLYTLIAILIGVVFAWAMSKGLTSGINKLLQAARGVQQGQRDVDFSLDRPDELGQLALGLRATVTTLVENETTLRDEHAKMEESEARFRALYNQNPAMFFTLDSNGVILSINDYACTELGYQQKNIIGQSILNIVADKEKVLFNRFIDYCFTHPDTPQRNETHKLRKDGSTLIVSESARVTYNQENTAILLIVCEDITLRKQAEENLRLFGRIFNESYEGIIIADANGLITDVNPTFSGITGYSREEAIGKSPNILNSGKHSPEFYENMWETIKEYGHWQGEVWNRKKDGELFAELLTITSILGKAGEILHYVGLFSDITQSKQQQDRLELMAHYDVLTQLPNRALFADRFAQAIARSKRSDTLLAICFLDLDNFKPVNDNHGHEIGDQLLIEVAQRIQQCIREDDTVSRQGGDEFAILLGGFEAPPQCEAMLERIHQSLAQPFEIEGYSHQISASSGATMYPLDDSDLDTLLRHADQAMYQAKLAGRNCNRLFDATSDQNTIKKHHQLQKIQHALLHNEFCLYYQPKVNMETGEVFGAEALIRWIDPELGLIPPLDFLPIIEGTELEIKIGDWVIAEALKQLSEWKNQGLKFAVSVNISAHHMQFHSFIENLDAALAKYPNINSNNLQLEILESSVIHDLNFISNIINTCKNGLGVDLALDDFGTGYSSLTHLRNLSVNTIKIDQTFVRDMLDDPDDYAIIDGVIALANTFDRKVIAEGVETTEHGLMLLSMGCNQAQGYGIARPMPADELLPWLANYTPNQTWLTHKNQSLQGGKIELYRLSSTQWMRLFEKNIQLSPESIDHWPIMDFNKCHCGKWIRRSIIAKEFDANWLAEFDQTHRLFHHIANDLKKQHQAGKIDSARKGLVELQENHHKIIKLLEQEK